MDSLKGLLPEGVKVKRIKVSGEKQKGHNAIKPAPDFTHNPLLKLPVNMRCPCGSGLKFKKCCRPLTRPFIPKEGLKEHQETYQQAMAGAKCW
jgi:hypothetical protein